MRNKCLLSEHGLYWTGTMREVFSMGGGVNYRQHGGEHLSNKKELLRI